jgi:hypothetical protein
MDGNFRKKSSAVLAALLMLLVFSTAAGACPNCKNALLESGDLDAVTRMKDGYFWSYVVMSSMPFLAIGTIAFLLFQSARKAAKTH